MRGVTNFGPELMTTFDASVALAGPWAEARWRAGRRPANHEVLAVLNQGCGHRGVSGAYKRATASDAALVAAAGGVDAVSSGLGGLLEQCWPAIVAVAQKLVRTGEAVHEDVTAALGLSVDRSRHPFELANIRADLRTVRTPGSAETVS
ncbi:hypothetical protein ORI20_27660 [Mycobacterium sp. CVI_P3]|uniref:Uncharacterized protein n=1 Tax=Mycobacterium pinniadriaticum TaxID=2994102 RepID=A0ABT3SMQ6_9MYCO|nr:hypothetical protein [Mycobacterium pinniadriaticum]MCX2934050.1 hypothetical protein [Mycobacterium pinniadriaticum]MCX2940453.1 hypothetical protein [Mycobacterium pinniadriaticum]